MVWNFAILFEKGVRHHGQVEDSGKLRTKMQDLTPASCGQTPTTPGQPQPDSANPTQLSQPRPEIKSPYPRPASVSPNQTPANPSHQATSSRSVGAGAGCYEVKSILNPSPPQKLGVFFWRLVNVLQPPERAGMYPD